MNPSQGRLVRASFSSVSEILDSLSRLSREDLSAFSKERGDLSAYESRMLLSFVAELRSAMLDALDRLGVPPPHPSVSARWSALTALNFIDITLAELRPEALRGYGQVEPADAEAVSLVSEEIRRLVARTTKLLRGGGYAHLEERVEGAPAPARKALGRVLALAREHQLVELYPEIDALAERAASPVADVGVFGRISAGKSSLINALVGAPALPVGATPVTALPLRVERGEPAVFVQLGSGRTEKHPLEDLPLYAAESGNPDNRRGVSGLEINVPTAPEGLRFLDTPGVGAYTTPTTASPFAWLPRCDLGLVLVAAGNPVEQEDLALLSGLQVAGVEWHILLSKADLLSDGETEAAVRYVEGEVQRALEVPPPLVIPVSTVSGSEDGLEHLGREVIEPLLQARRVHSRARFRRRFAHLTASARAALEGRRSTERGDGVERQNLLSRASRQVRRVAEELPRSAAVALEGAVDEIVGAWRSGSDAGEIVQRVVAEPPTAALATVRQELAQVAHAVPGAESLAEYGMPPLFTPGSLQDLPDLSPPWLPLAVVPRYRARRRLESLRSPLVSAYLGYGGKLRNWGLTVLERIAEAEGITPGR